MFLVVSLTCGANQSHGEVRLTYSEYVTKLNELITESRHGSRRVSTSEVERLLNEFISGVTSVREPIASVREPTAVSMKESRQLLRAALDAASIAPGLTDKIPVMARQAAALSGDFDQGIPSASGSAALTPMLEEGLERLLNAREFDRAEAFAREHDLNVPKWAATWRPPIQEDAVTYLEFVAATGIEGSNEKPTARDVNLMHGKWLIVEVHPDCGPSRSAMTYLSRHPEVMSNVPTGRVLFVVSQSRGQALPSVLEWNRENPRVPMVLSYHNRLWPKEITFLGTPVFNFLVDGKVVGRITGWPGDSRATDIQREAAQVFAKSARN